MNSALKKPSIADLRQEIDVVDEKLIKLLAERQRLVEAIIAVKQRKAFRPAFPPAWIMSLTGPGFSPAPTILIPPWRNQSGPKWWNGSWPTRSAPWT